MVSDLPFERGAWVEVWLNADLRGSMIGQITTKVTELRGFRLRLHRITSSGRAWPNDGPSCANVWKEAVIMPGSIAFMRILDGQPEWCRCESEGSS